MIIEFKHPETGSDIRFETEKKFIVIYGKNGSGKTTLSRNSQFKKELVFNEDFVNLNIYTVTESGAVLSTENRKNFSRLWIGADIVAQSKRIEVLSSVINENNTKLDEITLQVNQELNKALGESNLDTREMIIQGFVCIESEIDAHCAIFKYGSYKSTSIINEENLNSEIVALKNNLLLSKLHKKISESFYLNKLFLMNDSKGFTEDFNDRMLELSHYQDILNQIDLVFSNKKIDSTLEEKIRDWVIIHESLDSCIYCGNKEINLAKKEWKEIFTSEAKTKKRELIKSLNLVLNDIDNILNDRIEYQKIDVKTVVSLDNLRKIILLKLVEIGKNEYQYMQLDSINPSSDLQSVETKKLQVFNYILNKYLDKLVFYSSNDLALKNKRDNEKTILSNLMEVNGQKYSDGINEVLTKLGLNKEIEFKVNRRSPTLTYEFKLIDSREIKTLSDGQKHKLALAMFLYSLKEKDYKDQIIVIDDPVVSLDVLSYHQVKSFLIKDLISTFENNGEVKLILLTHNINYLYIQLSNIFEDTEMNEITEVYRLGNMKIDRVDLDIFRTDDITLFKTALKNISGVKSVYLVSNLILKVFRLMIDIRLRFSGHLVSDDVGIGLLSIDEGSKAISRENHAFLCKYFKEKNDNNADITIEGFNRLKISAEIMGFQELISEIEIEKIKKILLEGTLDDELEKPCFDILKQIDYFLSKSTDTQLKNYIRHPKNTFTKNMVTLCMNNDI